MVFQSYHILQKKNVALKNLLLAGHGNGRLSKQIIFTTDITKSSETITSTLEANDMNLRMSGSLLLGVVRIFAYKVKFLSTDCDQALTKMKMSFRPGMEKNDGKNGEGSDDEDDDEDEDMEGESKDGERSSRKKRRRESTTTVVQLSLDILPPMGDEWRHAAAQTIARKQDITMEESEGLGHSADDNRGLGGGHRGEDEQWEAFNPKDFEGDVGDMVEPMHEDEDADQEGASAMQTGEDPEVGRFSRGGGGVEEEKDSGYDHYGDDDYAPMEMDDDDDDEPPKLNDDDQDQAPPPPQDDDDDDDNNGYHQLPPSPSGEPFIDKDSGFLSPNMSLNMSKDAASLNSKSQKRKSKKRPLGRDKVTQISSADMKAQLADTTDVIKKRIRPRDWVHVNRQATLEPPEVRMVQPLIQDLSPDLNQFFSKLMVTPKHLDLPIRTTARYVHKKEDVVVQAIVDEKEGSTTEDEDVAPSKEEEEYYDDDAMPQYDYDDDDDNNGGAEMGEERQQGDQTDGDEDDYDDEDGFVRQNDAHEAGSATQWHPNTVKMCQLLRKKMEGGHEVVSFNKLVKGSRRSKAANKFFEVLQLKTWDFIQVHQARPFSDINITPATRFHEPIPT